MEVVGNMNKQEVINELLGLINVIKMNSDMFKEEYDKTLITSILYTIKKIKLDKVGNGDEDN